MPLGACAGRRQMDAADGTAERRGAKTMLRHMRRHGLKPATIGADTGFDDGAFLADVEADGTVPHVPIRAGPIRATDEAGQARRRAHNHFWQNSRLTEITLRLILWFNGWPPEQLIDAVGV